MRLLLTNLDYLDWVGEVYTFTLEAIESAPEKLVIMQNLMSFWCGFVHYVTKMQIESANTIRNMIYKVSS